MRILAAATLVLVATTGVASAQTHVDGYVKRDGTYVQPHERSSPNSTTDDNWSTKGNTNPYTGREGTRNPTPSLDNPRQPSNSSRSRTTGY